jgi:hypothetical protein
MLASARSDVSMLADSRDAAPPGTGMSDATSAPAVAAWELAPAREKLKEWTLTRLLATRPAAEPVVFTADTPIGEALQARARRCCACDARAQRATTVPHARVRSLARRSRAATADAICGGWLEALGRGWHPVCASG